MATSKIVSLKEVSGVPAELGSYLAEHAGEGTSSAQEDNLIPLIYILQKNSPQVDERDPNYVSGAKAGDLWLKGTSKVWSGSEGMVFQSCYWSKDIVEWIPRDTGGGYVGRHDAMPEEARQTKSPKNPDKMVWVNAKGDHEFVETRYHSGFVLEDSGQAIPAVIPLSSTGNTVSRNWMNLMNSFKIPGSNRSVPSFARAYRLTTAQKTNKSGTWFTIKVTDLGYLPLDQVKMGAELHEAFRSGAKKSQAPEDMAHTEEDEAI